MKVISSALRALFATGQFVMCDLHRFALSDGTTVLRYSTSDFSDVAFGSETYLSSTNGPAMERNGEHASVKWTSGLEVDTLDFEAFPDDTDMVANVPFLKAIRVGAFDDAAYSLYRAYFAQWTDANGFLPIKLACVGAVLMFPGVVCEVQGTRTGAKFSVNSFKERLSMQVPQRLFQASCLHTLYDAGCTLDKAPFTVSGTIAAVSSQSQFTTNLTGQASSYYNLGAVIFTSGMNAGYARSVKTYINGGGAVGLLSPAPFMPAAGDTFSIYPGCDKTQATCTNKYANFPNFLATPNVPAPETAI